MFTLKDSRYSFFLLTFPFCWSALFESSIWTVKQSKSLPHFILINDESIIIHVAQTQLYNPNTDILACEWWIRGVSWLPWKVVVFLPNMMQFSSFEERGCNFRVLLCSCLLKLAETLSALQGSLYCIKICKACFPKKTPKSKHQ